MTVAIRVPPLPESIADARVLNWHKRPGEPVSTGETLVELETDKVILEVPAPQDGVLDEILAETGAVVGSDALLAALRPSIGQEVPPVSRPPASAAPPPPRQGPHITPSARPLIDALGLDPGAIPSSGRDGRIHKADVMAYLDAREQASPPHHPDLGPPPAPAGAPPSTGGPERLEQRVPMTRLRARIAERLVEAQRQAALLTTFNEVNMRAIQSLRARYRDDFEQRHGVRLGLMSFFVKTAVEALKRFPVLNAAIDGDDIVYHGYYDIGIAVSTPRGLVVPILRDCDRLSLAEIEQRIAKFAQKAKDGTLSLDELAGGTFSITNGGVFGSLLSTPIVNPPQSAILGMHRIQERPIAEKGQVVIAPMMYLALTYDHRLIDGREAVQCLVTIKDYLEDPSRLLLGV
ncbi:2-oxoglutarate dehydrogenase complex dihydrolipoyllysine-residue succinyltransferase [Caldichromatium japonicum]|uniref:Dihydrolipoyllysine-residue succinyltransferase component of 2-oxoglutarate dehydrogenase complex n=1 Tax=Caldichromatium japonicum TaxID=2699430 RepID=A0A6G7VAZ4_9GAMM|nr:2-oxoglutarate dehydrogenase complex dihydrolipoyllysine-residue succinyltransferase [Caldichromatium japonicum]QIK37243.1 2-oxoglutarate dehydrogenase complex dihydrolipoyllysine-residue succinyltransferase [Caldichromatium japonicum]